MDSEGEVAGGVILEQQDAPRVAEGEGQAQAVLEAVQGPALGPEAHVRVSVEESVTADEMNEAQACN